jgi:galactose mutarotase-like enzyme
MIYEIMSDGAVAQLETKGAELQSLKDIFGTEYIWQGDAKYWGRRSPVLFPIIGKQKGGKFEYGGKTYELSSHGFARDSEFEVIAHDRNRLLFSLAANERTLQVYPFHFSLQVAFSLENTVLTVEYRIANTGDTEMIFSIGGHTGYNCPIAEDETFEEYFIEFEKEETCERLLVNKDGLFSSEKKPLLNGSRSFRLEHSLFESDAIVPDDLKSKSVSMINQKTGRGVRVGYDGFDNLAIWSAKGEAPFVCLEPWNGCASTITDSQRLEDKSGIKKLAAGSYYSVSHTISLL